MASNNIVGTLDVNVLSNAATAIPKQVQQGLNNAQKYANSQPIKLSFDTKNLRGLNLQKQLSLGVISREANEFDKSIKAATARTLAFGIAAGSVYQIIRAFSSLVTTSIEVEKTLKEIQVVSDASTESFKEYSKGIFDVARSTSSAFKDASKAALEFARQGISLPEQLERTKNSLILVKTAGIQVDKAVEAITASLNTFNNQLKDSTDLVDRLTAVDNSFAVSTGDLAESLERVGNTAQQANITLNQTLGAVTALQTRTARGGAVIGNALKSIFTKIQNPENIELLNNLGVATETAAGKSRNAIDVLKDLAGVYKNLNDAQKTQIGTQIAGLYQINQFNALIQDLSSNYSILEQATNKAANSQGSANERIKELNTTTAALLQQTATSFTELSSQIGKLTFETPLKNILSAGNGIVGALTESLNSIDTEGETVGSKFAEGILKGIGNVLGGSGIILIGRALGPLFAQFAKFTVEVLKNSVGINAALKSQIELQNRVNAALLMASAEERARITNATTLNQQLQLTLQLLKAQSTIKINPLTTALYDAGVRPASSNSSVKIPKGFAGGYAPGVIRQEISQIKSSPDYSGARNARPQLLSGISIGGKKQSVIINSAEKVVPTRSIASGYTGPDKYSILNPAQQKFYGMAGGSLPFNLNDINNIKTKAEAATYFKYLEKQGLLPGDFSVDTFRKANVQNARRLLRRVVETFDTSSSQALKPAFETGAKRFGEELPAARTYSEPKDIRPGREEKRRQEIRDELYKQDVEEISRARKSALIKRAAQAAEVLRAKQQKDDTRQSFREEKALKKDLKAKYKEIQDAIDARVKAEKVLAQDKRDSFLQERRARRQDISNRRQELRVRLANERTQRFSNFESFLQGGSGVLNDVLFEKNLKKQLGGVNSLQRRELLNRFSEQISTRRLQSSQRLNSLNQAGTIGLAIGLPLASGLVDSFAGNTAGGRAAASGLNLAGVGASVGGFFGPMGLGIGAGLGLLGGVGSSLLNEKNLRYAAGTQGRLKKVAEKDEQLSIFSTFIQQQATLQDLLSQGNATPDVLKNQATQINNTLKNLNDPSIIKGLAKINPDDPFETRITAYQKLQTEQEEKNRQKERRIVAGDDLKTLRDEIFSINNKRRGSFALSKFGLAPSGYAGSKIANLSLPENEKILKNISLSLLDSAGLKNGITSNDFKLDRSSSTEDILKRVLTPQSFTDAQKRLEGITGPTRDQILSQFFDDLKRFTEFTKQTADAIKQPFDRKSFNNYVSTASSARELSINDARLDRQRRTFNAGLRFNTESPFLSELDRSIGGNSLELNKIRGEYGNNKSQLFNSLIGQITQSIPADKLGLVQSNLKSLQKASPESIGGIIDNIKSNVSKSDISGDIVSGINNLISEYFKNSQILESTYKEEVRQNKLTELVIKKQEEISRNIGALGGISAIGNRGEIIGGLGAGTSKSSISSAYSRRNLSPFIGGGRYIEQRNKLSVGAAQEGLSDYNMLVASGVSQEEARRAVNQNQIKAGNRADIDNTLFSSIRKIASQTGLGKIIPSFGGVINNAKRPEEILNALYSTRGGLSNPDNLQKANRAISLIKPLVNQYAISDYKSDIQTRSALGLGAPSSIGDLFSENNPLVQAATGIKTNTEAMNQNVILLTGAIGTLNQIIQTFVEAGKSQSSNNTFDIDISGDTSNLVEKIALLESQIQLIFGRVGQVAAAQKITFPPAPVNLPPPVSSK